MFLSLFGLLDHGSVNEFYRTMGAVLSSCLLFISNSLFLILSFGARYLFRLRGEDGLINCLLQNWFNGVSAVTETVDFKNTVYSEETVVEEHCDGNFEHGDGSEKEQSTDPIDSEKDQTLSEKKFEPFELEPGVVDFDEGVGINNPLMDSTEPSYSFKFQYQTAKDFRQRLEESDVEHFGGWISDQKQFSDTGCDNHMGKQKLIMQLSDTDYDNHSDTQKSIKDDFEFLSENDFGNFLLNSSVSSTCDFFSEESLSNSSFEDEFLSDKDFIQINLERETEIRVQELPVHQEHFNEETSNFLSEKDFLGFELNTETVINLREGTPMNTQNLMAASGEKTELVADFEKTEEIQNQNYDDSEDSNSLESLWEHQDLIEQLRSEMKKVRAIGLPTILEESESPKIIDDLKPWKIDEKFLREERTDELQKFYRTYRERMRKFDIFNYQKMYAIGFLKLKHPLQSVASHKNSIPTIFRQNLRLRRGRKYDVDPSATFIRELESDLETVYVGQACLSWEFLHWQYGKAKELTESDPHGYCRYNEVAEEFQRFQVLLQRFMENEPFLGTTRVQSYVKNRCVLRNLLQVPLVREEKKFQKGNNNDAISSTILVEILEESMRIFWNFIKADKDETAGIFKGFLGTQAKLQDSIASELLADIQTSLQKKEKKLKDLVKSSSCLVKKFQKQHDHGEGQALFFSQVDMKLVSRVLKMSRITSDQLAWCHKKLNKITFRDRRLHREPLFLLFPC